jgi:hypothetical protein
LLNILVIVNSGKLRPIVKNRLKIPKW